MALSVALHISFDIVAGALLALILALVQTALEAWPLRGKKGRNTYNNT